ncbi:MAG: protein-L-isoaspartate(D-aspartate) O-methyltransferase [Rhodothermales bacterium]|nr:protein-L-isoaspartate(D-aspartate) O-methyltransferase [Rhodothermales bacterium]
MLEDDRKYQRQRAELVEELRARGISDERVLGAIGRVPRHGFVEPALRGRAYRDEALPIGLKQTISQPFTVAYQTMLLDPQPGEKILEIGTGSGYQAAVLCELGVRLFSIERHKPLLDRTQRILDRLGYRVVLRHGDGWKGWAAGAPFDGIIVTAGAASVPDALLDQLRVPASAEAGGTHLGGRLVIPVGGRGGQVMTRIIRTGEETYEREETHSFRFVPLVRGPR